MIDSRCFFDYNELHTMSMPITYPVRIIG